MVSTKFGQHLDGFSVVSTPFGPPGAFPVAAGGGLLPRALAYQPGHCSPTGVIGRAVLLLLLLLGALSRRQLLMVHMFNGNFVFQCLWVPQHPMVLQALSK